MTVTLLKLFMEKVFKKFTQNFHEYLSTLRGCLQKYSV